MAVAVSPSVRQLVLTDFSGGLNLRDSPTELSPNETPDAVNWTIDQRGAIRNRNGCANVAALPGVSGKAAFIFYSEALDQWLCARETVGTPNNMRLFTSPVAASGAPTGVWTDRGTLGINLAMLAAFVDWPGQTPMVVLAAAGVGAGSGGGTWTWNGTTLTGVTGGLAGYGLAVWQNRVWRVGYPIAGDTSSNFARLEACKPGDPTLWGVANGGTTVDIRIKDASRLTGIGLAGDALVVFKRRSAYRISDSATGEPHLLDGTAGCQGPLAIIPARGRLYTWGADGLYEWDGVGSGRNVGDKARPLFVTDAGLIAGVPALCGGLVEDRLLFAYPSAAGDNNDRLLEYDPLHGWLMKHLLTNVLADEVSSFARKGADLYGALRDANVIYSVFSELPGFDDGQGFLSHYYTLPWLQPTGGRLARLNRAQVEGLITDGGSLSNQLWLNLSRDWNINSGPIIDIGPDLRSANPQAVSIQHSLGLGRAFRVQFQASAGVGTSFAASISALALDFIPLET